LAALVPSADTILRSKSTLVTLQVPQHPRVRRRAVCRPAARGRETVDAIGAIEGMKMKKGL